ncbi:MAG: hypothetical protein KKC18_14380 [Chloroflexi bacterium]|nr:hypothetical protein [Chloroflexota bacterium]
MNLGIKYENLSAVAADNTRNLATGANWPREAVEAAASFAEELACSPEYSGLTDPEKVSKAVATALNAHRPEAPLDYAMPAHKARFRLPFLPCMTGEEWVLLALAALSAGTLVLTIAFGLAGWS